MNAAIIIANHFHGGPSSSMSTLSTQNQSQSQGSSAGSQSNLGGGGGGSGSVTSLNSFDSEYELGTLIVAQALCIQQAVIRVLQDDSALLQSTWLNCSGVFAKHALMNLDTYMHSVSSAAEPSLGHKMNLIHVQNVWNELVISIACHGVEMATNFITLPCGELPTQNRAKVGVKTFKIDEHNSNEDRVSYFFDQFGIVEVLVQMIALSYRKAGRLKMLKAQKDGEREIKIANAEITDPVILVEQHGTDNNVGAGIAPKLVLLCKAL